RVIHERAGEKLAAVVVVAPVFEQRLPDALGDAALHLALDQHRLQHPAAIVDRGIGGEHGAAGLGVDLDLGDVAAVGEGGGGVDALLAVEACGGGDLEQADAAVGADDLENAAAIGDVGLRSFENLGGGAAALLDHRVGRGA